MVSPTHCWTNCAEVDLPLCLPCVFRFSSVFVLSLLFIFIFVSFFSFYFIWRRHRWNSNWLVAMPRCFCFSVPPRDFNGITPWSSSGAVAIVASIGRLVDWKNWLIYCRAANSLCTFFPSGVQQIVCGTIETETVVFVGIPREFALNLLFILVCFFLHWTLNNAGDYKNLLMALGCWTRTDSLVFQLSLLPE